MSAVHCTPILVRIQYGPACASNPKNGLPGIPKAYYWLCLTTTGILSTRYALSNLAIDLPSMPGHELPSDGCLGHFETTMSGSVYYVRDLYVSMNQDTLSEWELQQAPRYTLCTNKQMKPTGPSYDIICSFNSTC